MYKSQSLAEYNSFGIAVEAARYLAITSEEQLKEILPKLEPPLLVLGGGSNILFTEDPAALILHNRIRGREVVQQSEEDVIVRIGGGEPWHQFVLWTLENNWGGLENLSLIPGTVGASPIQNIGAYGVELKDVFHGLEAIDLQSGETLHFTAEECAFGYRSSVFKTTLKGKVMITRVLFRLSRKDHQINTDYGAIRDTLAEWKIDHPGIQDVSRAVIAIRQSKLPDPKVVGNAGSFFKNPEIEAAQFQELQDRFPNLVYYPLPDGRYKIPAGWLIDQSGWKGQRFGAVGCYDKQALVLVNYGDAKGTEVVELANRIVDSVEEKYGIRLETEVNII
ncbi:UDP-N-acetylmuramate dehydrogenase [Flavilitoribacter nigricans]|uniref:UDP-N-acetylenolpyruvoylglucosamine reductase n=1 Tax=Flavilitoribacter nigricans (strain ATCC 23147 / DSM 23189 / NBRC 102662 / NCIMB 1420 / SS-2) TaxID=1122177 RepID=A0A2D0NJ61_FLAN2|nr:UDP-N-acetylmuramate dehydrogenase [Flavilitoribacter nigricans]PHN08396.1 UDP-N-acetylenolpyruvoylglucosamine reductase [Flavilitoribacter nigricans DSM 23189 = NBRC 102662]